MSQRSCCDVTSAMLWKALYQSSLTLSVFTWRHGGHDVTSRRSCCERFCTSPLSLLSVFTCRHGGHVGVPKQGHFSALGNEAICSTPEKFENADLFFTVRPTICTNPSWKRSFSKTLFKRNEFENAGFAFSCGRKPFWKTELFESDDFPARVFLGIKVQNGRCLLRFVSVFLLLLLMLTSDAFSESKRRFSFSNFSGIMWTGPEWFQFFPGQKSPVVHSRPPGKAPIQYCLVLDEFLANSVDKGKENKTLNFINNCKGGFIWIIVSKCTCDLIYVLLFKWICFDKLSWSKNDWICCVAVTPNKFSVKIKLLLTEREVQIRPYEPFVWCCKSIVRSWLYIVGTNGVEDVDCFPFYLSKPFIRVNTLRH